MKHLLLVILVGFSQISIGQAKADEALIREARQQSNAAIARRDVDAIISFWLDDYVVVRGSGVIAPGKEANKLNWEGIFKEAPQTRFERTPSEVIVSKNNPEIGWESGTWKGYNTYSKGGRYSAQWKKKDGEWKLQAELFAALDK